MNDKEQKAHKVNISSFQIYQPTTLQDKNYTHPLNNLHEKFKYYARNHPDINLSTYNNFPILLNKDGSLWIHANKYLISKLDAYKKPKYKTLASVASDLVHFKRFCDTNHIDYLSASRKVLRPTWLYRNYLNEESFSPNTIKRKMTNITSFYDWLITYEKITFKFPLWNKGETFVHYKDQYGYSHTKKVETKDVNQVKNTKNNDLYTNHIEDGGKLAPLTQQQQIILFKSLETTQNIEMKLAFLIALFTGSRIQTVFTLRRKQFIYEPKPDEHEIKIYVGHGTDCDTKYSKNFTLYFPVWLFRQIQIYIHSIRSINRLNNSKNIYESDDMQYIFLTNRGSPYYISEYDPNIINYKTPPDGSTVRNFIRTSLKNEIIKLDKAFTFSFHDLRATFGINYLEAYMPIVEAKKVSLDVILNRLRVRMAHESLATTARYLNYRDSHRKIFKAQNDHEIKLRNIVGY